MRRLLLTFALLLAGIAYAAPVLPLGALPPLVQEEEEGGGDLDGRSLLAPHLRPSLRRSFRTPAAPAPSSLPSGDEGETWETAPRQAEAPRQTAPTRLLIHRYNE